MDSLTQIVLGAAVGEALMGKEVGNRAPLMGAVIGTLPDLDVISSLFQSELDALVTHRSLTHSILFAIAMAPLLGWLIHKKAYRKLWGTQKRWSWLAFWVLFTHSILDCFTSWGTQLFYPFSSYRVAVNNIFVVDPIYTLPFLICLLAAICLARESKWRRYWNWAGIIISSFYLILTLTNKMVVQDALQKPLHDAGISHYSFSTYPTPFNNILWYCVAEEAMGDRFAIGFYSLLYPEQETNFIFVPKNENLLYPYQNNPVIEKLKWITKGQYAVEEKDGYLIWHDLRFGIINPFTTDPEEPYAFAFSYRLLPKEGPVTAIQQLIPFESQLAEMGTMERLGYMYDKLWTPIWEKITGN